MLRLLPSPVVHAQLEIGGQVMPMCHLLGHAFEGHIPKTGPSSVAPLGFGMCGRCGQYAVATNGG